MGGWVAADPLKIGRSGRERGRECETGGERYRERGKIERGDAREDNGEREREREREMAS